MEEDEEEEEDEADGARGDANLEGSWKRLLPARRRSSTSAFEGCHDHRKAEVPRKGVSGQTTASFHIIGIAALLSFYNHSSLLVFVPRQRQEWTIVSVLFLRVLGGLWGRREQFWAGGGHPTKVENVKNSFSD